MVTEVTIWENKAAHSLFADKTHEEVTHPPEDLLSVWAPKSRLELDIRCLANQSIVVVFHHVL
jgi:hypothetical protein